MSQPSPHAIFCSNFSSGARANLFVLPLVCLILQARNGRLIASTQMSRSRSGKHQTSDFDIP
eukprot:3212746-Amphidinium_carterae.2